MTELEALKVVAGLIRELGPGGVLLVVVVPGLVTSLTILLLWWVTSRQTAKQQESYRADMLRTLHQYGEHQSELRQMYENNVELVRVQQKIADALHTTVVRNTEAMTRLCDAVVTNRYCPLARRGETTAKEQA